MPCTLQLLFVIFFVYQEKKNSSHHPQPDGDGQAEVVYQSLVGVFRSLVKGNV